MNISLKQIKPTSQIKKTFPTSFNVSNQIKYLTFVNFQFNSSKESVI